MPARSATNHDLEVRVSLIRNIKIDRGMIYAQSCAGTVGDDCTGIEHNCQQQPLTREDSSALSKQPSHHSTAIYSQSSVRRDMDGTSLDVSDSEIFALIQEGKPLSGLLKELISLQKWKAQQVNAQRQEAQRMERMLTRLCVRPVSLFMLSHERRIMTNYRRTAKTRPRGGYAIRTALRMTSL